MQFLQQLHNIVAYLTLLKILKNSIHNITTVLNNTFTIAKKISYTTSQAEEWDIAKRCSIVQYSVDIATGM